MFLSLQRRAESCIKMHGDHTKHLLLRSHEHRQYPCQALFQDSILQRLFAHLSKPITFFIILCNVETELVVTSPHKLNKVKLLNSATHAKGVTIMKG
jgi:hypothetical protein